ncbi:histone-lysine N-methyltransferase SETMAR [Trichonephila clavipes]|nr:histone-lysine N-methyltransferase SETMAR [Trichonephila clavipes]
MAAVWISHDVPIKQFKIYARCQGIFDVKDAQHIGRLVVKNVDKATEIIEIYRHAGSRSIAQELKIDHKTVLNHLHKVGFEKKLDRSEAAQTVSKPGLTARKVLLNIWWDWKEKNYYALLLYDQTLNSDLYCQQLDHLKPAIGQKRLELTYRISVVFHQDNARTHTSVVTRQKLWKPGWEVLMHPPYSLDLAPSDYHLFLALQNFLSDKKLGSREDCELID